MLSRLISFSIKIQGHNLGMSTWTVSRSAHELRQKTVSSWSGRGRKNWSNAAFDKASDIWSAEMNIAAYRRKDLWAPMNWRHFYLQYIFSSNKTCQQGEDFHAVGILNKTNES